MCMHVLKSGKLLFLFLLFIFFFYYFFLLYLLIFLTSHRSVITYVGESRVTPSFLFWHNLVKQDGRFINLLSLCPINYSDKYQGWNNLDTTKEIRKYGGRVLNPHSQRKKPIVLSVDSSLLTFSPQRSKTIELSC